MPRARAPRLSAVSSGYVGILTFDLHFPEGGSLKAKRKELLSLKSDLQRRVGASVAEVDHHELWQRSRITASCVARDFRELERLLDDAERYLHGQEFECTRVERKVVTLDE